MTVCKKESGIAAAVLIMLLTVAATTARAQGNILQATLGETDPTPEVSTAEVRRLLSEGGAVLLDSRSREQYDAGHIPGAVHIDLASDDPGYFTAVERLLGGNRDAALVLYCNGPKCGASRSLSKLLIESGFSNVKRYQLGIPIWRSLGGPTEIELDGILRIYGVDQTAVFFDARSPAEFARISIPGTHNVPAEHLEQGVLDEAPKPRNDFNTRIIIFGKDRTQARKLAEAMGEGSAYHNVNYYPGEFDSLRVAIGKKSGGR
jgi:rhodanese-related sulfurtransferase